MSNRRPTRAEKDTSFHRPKREKLEAELSKKTCISCRKAKKRCDGTEPCGRCVAKKIECVYVVQVESKEMQGKVEEMDTLQRALKEANALIQEKQRIHAQLDKQREELKKEYLQLKNQLSDRSEILFTSSYENRTIQCLDFYMIKFHPTTKNIMPYDKVTDFMHDENPARVACMCAMLANGSLVVGDMKNAKYLFAQAKQSLLKCLEKLVVADIFLYTSTLVDLGTHCLAFCDLNNARPFFYKIIELARNFPQQFFSTDLQASRSSFALAQVSTSIKARAGSPAYHLGYAYETLLVICADQELDAVQLSVANAPALIGTHARFHQLRTHLDKLNQIAIIFSYEYSAHLFNWPAFEQELIRTKLQIDVLDPHEYAYLVGLEKVVQMHGYLAAMKSQEYPGYAGPSAVNPIEDVFRYAKRSLEDNKANLLAFAMLYAAIVCRHELNADAMVLLRMRKEIEAETSGVDLVAVCLHEYEQSVALRDKYCPNPYFAKFSLHLDTRHMARLQPEELRRFALHSATTQELAEICDYDVTGADE